MPYAIRGAIWNQGYANMGEGLPYYNNLHSLVRGWRIGLEEARSCRSTSTSSTAPG